jgi:hypothetical protein
MATYGNGLYRSELPTKTVKTFDSKQSNAKMVVHTDGNIARIYIPNGVTDDIFIQLIDISGNTIANLTNFTQLNEHFLETTLPHLPSGVYIFNVIGGLKQYSQKVLTQK